MVKMETCLIEMYRVLIVRQLYFSLVFPFAIHNSNKWMSVNEMGLVACNLW